MKEYQSPETTSLILEFDQALIALPESENGHETTRYFVDETAADQATPHAVTEDALQAIGAWGDLDWREMEEALDRIRHESIPTPPLDL